MKLRVLAERLQSSFTGDGEVELTGVAGIETAGPGQLTFLPTPRYRRRLRDTRAAAIIVATDYEDLPLPTVRSVNPYLAFARALEFFYQPPPFPAGIHPTSVVSPRARVGREATIGPYCFIDDDVQIGDRARLHSFVSIYRGARIGDDFGRYYKIVQSGPVVVEDDVEIQAGATIDRATVGETRIGRGAKIDNLVQVGHASSVGENSLLCAQVGLAGSTKVGNDVILAGQAGVAGHCQIGDGVRVTAQSGLHGDIPAGQTLSGSPAIENRLWLKCVALYARLPEMYDELRALRHEVARLKNSKQ